MKLDRKDIKKTVKMLMDIKYEPADRELSYIFFPIDSSLGKDIDGLEFISKSTVRGIKEVLTPGLILSKENNETVVNLAYADVKYSPHFELIQYMDITNQTLNKNLEEFLNNNDCLIVGTEYVKAKFKL